MDITIYPSVIKGKARNIPDCVKIINFKKSIISYTSILRAIRVFRNYFIIYILDFLSTLKVEKINIFRYSRFSYIAGYWVRSFKFLLWYEGSDIDNNFFYYTYWMNAESYAVSILKRRNKSLVSVSRVHGGDIYIERNSGFLPFRRTIIKTLNGIHTISNHGKEYLINTYGQILNNKVQIARLGVSSTSRVVKSDNNIIVSSCSSDDPVKRVLLILQSLGEFSKQNNVIITWIHIGINKINFEKKYGSYITKYPNLKCKIVGTIPNNEVTGIYQKYQPSLFVNTSESEGLPVAIMEALSCGLPIIATNVGGTSEIVDSHVGALLDKNFVFNDIENAIFELVKHREKYSKMAFNKWKDTCNAEKNFSEFYLQLKRYHAE